MTNSDDAAVPPEPSSSPAPAYPRGPDLPRTPTLPKAPGLWMRLKAMLRQGSLRDDLEELLESAPATEGDEFSASERTILQNVLKLGDMRVDDVMVPRADIVAVDAGEPLSALLALFVEAGHSRLPIYDEDLDNITGFVHVKDVLRRIVEVPGLDDSTEEARVKVTGSSLRTRISKLDLVRDVLFVPPSTPVGDLLEQMQGKRVHMAIVIDEYGGTDGVVTIEDLLEAVVGEIEDEHDAPDAPLIRKLNSSNYIASARAELSEVREVIGPDFDPGELADEVDTIGGLVFDLAGRVPAAGEIVKGLKGFDFEILQSDGRQLQKLKIKRLRASKPRPVAAKRKPAEGAADEEEKTG